VLAVLGHTTIDVVDGGPPRAGGVPLYAGRALAAMGCTARVATRCAPADAGFLDALRATGLDVRWRAATSTPVFRHQYRGGVRETVVEALGEPWSPDDVRGWLDPVLRDVSWVHAGALWAGDFPPETLVRLAEGGRRVALDAHGLVRRAAVGPLRTDVPIDPAGLAHVAVLHLSEEEAAGAGLRPEPDSLSALGVPEVLLTRGSSGAVVAAGGSLEHVPGEPVDGADPTGAGDAFTAAYVASRDEGLSPVAAARRASRVVHDLLRERLTG
jgi:sugar/nucleoside kinase (ribokinase family)